MDGPHSEIKKSKQRARVTSFARKYAWPFVNQKNHERTIQLNDQVNIHEFKFVAHPSQTLRAVIVDESTGGPLWPGGVVSRHRNLDRRLFQRTKRNGVFEFIGRPRNVEHEIFVVNFPVVESKRIAASNRDVVDIGRIVALQHEMNATFNLTLTGFSDLIENFHLNGLGRYLGSGVTLISDQAVMILTWILGSDDRVILSLQDRESSPKAYPGRYYISPGIFAAGQIQLDLLDLIRSGTDLSESGIPFIEIRDDEVASVTVNAVEAYEAIRSAKKRLDEQASDQSPPDN